MISDFNVHLTLKQNLMSYVYLDNLPETDVLAADIIENLQAAMDGFSYLLKELKAK